MESKDIPTVSHELSEAMRSVGIAASEMTITLQNYSKVIMSAIKYMLEFIESNYPNKHVKHLCKYGYGRTKRKNINRMCKHLKKQAKIELNKRKRRTNGL